MSQDSKVISYLSAPELAALMNATGAIAVEATTTADSRPVIQAHLKITDNRTGEEIPGGLPFAVVMFKGDREPGCSNIAVAARIPVGALGIRLPANYFNLCNEQYRFVRVFPLGHDAIALQMDIYLHAATREYVKFAFGIWATAFSQVLYDLMSQRSEMSVSQDAVVAQHAAVVDSGALEAILPADLGGELVEAPVAAEPAAIAPEAAMPEAAMAEVATSDVAAPDVAAPDVVTHDAATSDADATIEAILHSTEDTSPVDESILQEEPVAELAQIDATVHHQPEASGTPAP